MPDQFPPRPIDADDKTTISHSCLAAGLVCSHGALMHAYFSVIRQTTFPSDSFRATGIFPQSDKTKFKFRDLVALFAMIFGAAVLPVSLMAVLARLEAFLPMPARNEAHEMGLALITDAMVIFITVLGLNIWLSLLTPGFFRPVVRRIGAGFVRQHIRSQLDKLLPLYTALLAARTLRPEEQAQLSGIAEETGKLKDSIVPKWQLIDLLKYPSVVAGILFLSGFMRVAQFSKGFSIALGCLLFAPYVLACRLKHVALEFEIPGSDDTAIAVTSIYGLEAQLFQILGCSGGPRPIIIDLILQIVAGGLGALGCLVFVVQLGDTTPIATFFWVGVESCIVYFFIFAPIRELRKRRERYTNAGLQIQLSEHSRIRRGDQAQLCMRSPVLLVSFSWSSLLPHTRVGFLWRQSLSHFSDNLLIINAVILQDEESRNFSQ